MSRFKDLPVKIFNVQYTGPRDLLYVARRFLFVDPKASPPMSPVRKPLPVDHSILNEMLAIRLQQLEIENGGMEAFPAKDGTGARHLLHDRAWHRESNAEDDGADCLEPEHERARALGFRGRGCPPRS